MTEPSRGVLRLARTLAWTLAAGGLSTGAHLAAGGGVAPVAGQEEAARARRAGGAGIPAFFTATGYGTIVAEGKAEQAKGDVRNAAEDVKDTFTK